jgi:hypothetical protein
MVLFGMRRWTVVLATAALAVAACREREAAEIGPAFVPSTGLAELRGAGYRLAYPQQARVDTVTSNEPGLARTVRVIGPSIAVRPAGQAWEWVGPGYRLEISEFDVEPDVALETWVRDRVRNSGGPPARLEDTVLAGYPARLAITFGGDADVHTYYVRAGDRVLGLRHDVIPPTNSPTASQQEAVHALLLATLRLDDVR